jgi:hypothetical protein
LFINGRLVFSLGFMAGLLEMMHRVALHAPVANRRRPNAPQTPQGGRRAAVSFVRKKISPRVRWPTVALKTAAAAEQGAARPLDGLFAHLALQTSVPPDRLAAIPLDILGW